MAKVTYEYKEHVSTEAGASAAFLTQKYGSQGWLLVSTYRNDKRALVYVFARQTRVAAS